MICHGGITYTIDQEGTAIILVRATLLNGSYSMQMWHDGTLFVNWDGSDKWPYTEYKVKVSKGIHTITGSTNGGDNMTGVTSVFVLFFPD